jgi:hypothetical protein
MSQIETDLGQTGSSSTTNLQFAVLAGNSTSPPNVQFTYNGTLSGVNAAITGAGQVTNGVGTLGEWLSNLTFTGNTATVAAGGANDWNGTNGPGLASPASNFATPGGTTIPAAAAIGTAMEFFSAATATGGPKGSLTESNSDLNGTWGYSLATDLATWMPTAAGGGSPVPVPAAVWLLLSGLVGVGGLSRRRAQVSATAAA